MKKGWSPNKWWLVCSICWYIAAIAMFLGSTDKSIALFYLCLGSAFLCLSVYGNHGKNDEKKNEDSDKDEENENNLEENKANRSEK
ncbi:MAG: hypothetical protein MJ107_09160 [Lachnospiraceae bacterium]|nr:hypothetical protein [Lachnospiraceae bacterium]